MLSVALVIRPHELVPYLGMFRPVLLLAALATGIVFATGRIAFSSRDTMTRWYVGLLLWGGISLPFAYYRMGGVIIIQKLIILTILVATFGALPVEPGVVRRIRDRFLLVFAAFALAVLVVGRQSREAGRLSGLTSYDPNELAAVCAVVLALAIGGMRQGSWFSRATAFLSMVLALLVIIRTGSRGGAVAAGLVILGSVLATPGWSRLTGLVAIGLAIMFAVGNPTARNRLMSIGTVQEDYNLNSYGGRVAIWQRGIGYMLQNPVMGVGLNNFTEFEGQTMQANRVRGAWLTAHNMFVQIGAELGIPGLLLLGGILLTAGRYAVIGWMTRAQPGSHPEMLLALMAVGVSGLFLSLAYSDLVAFTAALTGASARETRSFSRYPQAARPTPRRSSDASGRVVRHRGNRPMAPRPVG
jgi:O-antigen ligase